MNTQGYLTLIIEILAIGAVGLYGAMFIDGAMKRNHSVPGQLEIDFSAVQPEQPPVVEPIALFPASNIMPFIRPQPRLPNLEQFNIRQLKAIASAVKLPRYNKNTKTELAARLVAEVDRDRLMPAIGQIAA